MSTLFAQHLNLDYHGRCSVLILPFFGNGLLEVVEVRFHVRENVVTVSHLLHICQGIFQCFRRRRANRVMGRKELLVMKISLETHFISFLEQYSGTCILSGCMVVI